DHLPAQLEALANQTVDDFEVLVADNASRDGTVATALAQASRFRRLRVVDASSRLGSGHARNIGLLATRSSRLLFCDADDVVSPGWVRAHRDGLERFSMT